jgi:hypothetical protein
MATANNAGSSERAATSAHQVTPSGRSARWRLVKKATSCRDRNLFSAVLRLTQFRLWRWTDARGEPST